MFRMRPRPPGIIERRAAREHRNAPRRLTSTSRHHASGSTSQRGPTAANSPALLTSSVGGPSRSRISWKASTSSPHVTSARRPSARTPPRDNAEAASATWWWERARRATSAPSTASRSATARPIPRLAPVTTAICPFRTGSAGVGVSGCFAPIATSLEGPSSRSCSPDPARKPHPLLRHACRPDDPGAMWCWSIRQERILRGWTPAALRPALSG